MMRFLAAGAAAGFSLLVLGGCERPDGIPPANFECRCSLLTDTDVPVTKDIHVCAKTPERAKLKAPDCARGRTQLSVQQCRCKVVPEPCPSDACSGD